MSGLWEEGPRAGGIVVIGVGNELRRDDGVGIAVVQRARVELPDEVETVEHDGEPTRMLDTWGGTELAVVVDAVRSGSPPGTIVRFDVTADATVPTRPTGGSSHSLGLGESVALGRALDQMPARLVVLGIEGEEFGDGPGLTPAVEAAVADAARLVVAEVASQREEAP